MDRTGVQRAAGRAGRSFAHSEPRKGSLVFSGAAGDAALLSARRCGCAGAGLVVMALIVIPYFKVNIEAEGRFSRTARDGCVFLFDRGRAVGFPFIFQGLCGLVPTLIMAAIMLLAAQSSPQSSSAFRRYLAAKPLSYWVMTWFLFELVVLTAIGTFSAGRAWSWVWPWQGS